MVVGNHLFSFFDKKFREGVTRYELHPPSLRTVYFPTAPAYRYKYFVFCNYSLRNQQRIFYNFCPASCNLPVPRPNGVYHIRRNISRIIQ